MSNWIEKEVSISEIDKLLKSGHAVQIDSPDGFVDVNFYVDKGKWDEYILTTFNGVTVRCNENHLFETVDGWRFVKDITSCVVKTKNGWSPAYVKKSGRKIPIVDINVNHDNHRYYAEDISSHNTGVGKTLFMTHCAAGNLMAGLNVLYITMEMSEEEISKRIDANLLDVTLDDLMILTRDAYQKKMSRVKSMTTGKLIVKEYPTATVGVNHFRFLLNELKIKKNFVPDIVYVDYINLCNSSRMKMGANVNSYNYVKSVAEELRGLGVEYNVPIFTATQTNREGYGDSDFDLSSTSDSFGLPYTADFMFGLISSEELESMGQIMVKQLKNRWGDVNSPKRFILGIDRSKMRIYDLEDSAQPEQTDSPVADSFAPKSKPKFEGFA